MPYDVFISYSSKDKPIADGICAHLEAAGVRCWIAPRDIAPGDDWPTAIARAITECKLLVLVFTAHSNASDEVGRELFLATDARLTIVPFKIEPIEPEPGKQYYLANTHWLDAMNPPTREQILALVEVVQKLVPSSAANPQAAVEPAVAPSKRFRRPTWVWISALLLGGLVAGLLFSHFLPGLAGTQVPSPTLSPTPSATPLPMATLTPVPTDTPAATITPAINLDNAHFTRVYISETFDNNDLQWSEGDIVGHWWLGTRSVANGVFSWDGTSEQGMVSMVSPDAPGFQAPRSDQQVTVRVISKNQNPNVGYGIFFRSTADQSRMYTYSVSQGQYEFSLLDDDGWKEIIPWQASHYITDTGWNTLMVQAVGSHFRFYFNDHLLGEAEDATLVSGLSGVMMEAFDANQAIKLQFDDFDLRLPEQ